MRKLLITFLCCFITIGVFSQEIVKIIEKNYDETETIREVNKNEKEIYFSHSYAISIEGLEQLENLQKINFFGCAYLKNYDFISSCKNLKEINMQFCEPQKLDFLDNLSDIEFIGIMNATKTSFAFDFSKLSKLKLLNLQGSIIDNTKLFYKLPKSLECLYLRGAKVDNLNYKKLNQVKYILLDEKTAKGIKNISKYKNVYTVDDTFPKEYQVGL